MKKALILTVTAGNGHNACAKAMKNMLDRQGVEVKVTDLLKNCSTPINAWIADRGYALAVSKLPHVYKAFYDKYYRAEPLKRWKCSSQKPVLSTVEKLLKEIYLFKPDVIYCTHFYCAMAITDIRLVYGLPCKVISCNLDFANSPFWEACTGVDYFIIPHKDLIAVYLSEGYKREQLLPLGIPVDPRTVEVYDKRKAKRRLGLDGDIFTVLIMFGGGMWSGGFKIFKQIIRAVSDYAAQVIVINGRDKRAFEKVAKFKTSVKILNVGFTDNVPLYLSAADIAVTKCGGTGASEMINKGLPMLVSRKIPAQELYNLEYLQKKGVAFSFKNYAQLKEYIQNAVEDKNYLRPVKQNAKLLKNNSLCELAKFMHNLPCAQYPETVETAGAAKKIRAAVKAANKSAMRKLYRDF